MAVKGLTAARRNTKKLMADTSQRRVFRAITKVLITGAGFAAIKTPVDTSFLINGQYRTVTKAGDGYKGLIGYTAAYAAAVHDPANRQRFKKSGAEKLFLEKGFGDNLRTLEDIFAKEMRV